MSEDAVRQTRSQKRALERDAVAADSKRVKLDGAERSRSETAVAVRPSSIMSGGGEVKATIKLELQTGDEPMDMSSEVKREHRSPSPDDVIVLSDEAPSPQVNGGNHLKELNTDLLMRSSAEERERFIKTLKEELRLEEAKLILLKKLRQSQTQSSAQKPVVPVSSAPPPLVKGSTSAKTTQPQGASVRVSGAVVPPPLVRGGQVSKQAGAQILMPPLVRGAQTVSVTPQQISSLRQTQISSAGPPPLLLPPRAVSSVPGHKILQPGLIRMTSIPSGSLLVSINQPTGASLKTGANASDSPASRQAAAKLVLHKQLEKSLLDIPQPKAPAADFSFLPSAANNEFIYLVGLEEVVQNLLESLGRGKQGVYAGLVVSAGEPSCCSQCQTDFTSRWRTDRSGAVMCEQCVSSGQKRALKAEHTGRLKAAFVKALQQEKVLEQRGPQPLKRSSPSGQPKPDRRSGPTPSRHTVQQVSPSPVSRSVQPIRAVPHFTSSHAQLQNAVAAAALVSRPGVTMAYVNPSLSLHKSSSSSAVERHREYLLDMIPSRPVTHTTNTWKQNIG